MALAVGSGVDTDRVLEPVAPFADDRLVERETLHALVARGVLRERRGSPRQARTSVREALLGSWLVIEAPHTLGRFAWGHVDLIRLGQHLVACQVRSGKAGL